MYNRTVRRTHDFGRVVLISIPDIPPRRNECGPSSAHLISVAYGITSPGRGEALPALRRRKSVHWSEARKCENGCKPLTYSFWKFGVEESRKFSQQFVSLCWIHCLVEEKLLRKAWLAMLEFQGLQKRGTRNEQSKSAACHCAVSRTRQLITRRLTFFHCAKINASFLLLSFIHVKTHSPQALRWLGSRSPDRVELRSSGNMAGQPSAATEKMNLFVPLEQGIEAALDLRDSAPAVTIAKAN